MYEIPSELMKSAVRTPAQLEAEVEPAWFSLVWGRILEQKGRLVRGQGVAVVDDFAGGALSGRWVVLRAGDFSTAVLVKMCPWHNRESEAIESFERRVLEINWARETAGLFGGRS